MEEIQNSQLLFPFTSLHSIDEVEKKWRSEINEKENEVQTRSEYSPGSAEYNDRIRIINLEKLFKVHNNDYKQYLSQETIKNFLYEFSLQINSMNVKERGLRHRLISKSNSGYMEKLWLYLSFLYHPLIKQKCGNEYGKILIAAIKNLLSLFPNFLKNIINQEISGDKIIRYSSGYDEDDLEADITSKRIRPYKSFLTKDSQERNDEPLNKQLILSSEEKSDFPPYYEVDMDKLDESIKRLVETIFMDYMKDMNISQDVNNDEIKRNIEYSVRQQSISIYQDVIEELESITADKIIKKQVQKNLKSSDQAKQNLRQFTLKDLPETNADLYIGLLYEHDCFEIVYKAILTIKEPSEKDNMNGLIIIQTIILLGEAVKFAHGIRTDLNSDYSIIGTLIKLRNNFSGYVSWADLHNISNWNQIIDELNIIKKKIRARLCSLEKCFAENDPEKLKENVKNLLDQGLTFLYTPPEGLIIRMWLDKKQKKENRKKWQEHNDYPQLRDLLVNIENIKKQSNIPSIDNVITIVDELKKICNQIFQPPTFCHTLIVQKLNQDDKNNNLCAFLQLSYTINKLFQNLKTYIEHEQKDENWLNEIRKLEDYKLFELIYGLLRDGRHSTIHHMWRKDYENLASLICIISSNLKPILLALKSKTSGSADVNDMDLEMWWYLLWIKYELIIQHRGSSREMKYTSPWIGFHVIRAEEDKTGFLENLTIEEYANLLHTLHKVIKELLAIYLNADDYNSKLEKFKNTCQNYRLKRDMFFFWPNNICELSQHIESIFEEAIIGFRLTGLEHNIDDIIKNFETLVEQQKDEIHFNRYGLSDRTPLMFSMGLFSDNMIENEQASPIIKKLVTMLITNGADPDKYNSLTLHPMHYAALVGVEFKNYFEEYCNLKCPPDGVFGINSQQFYENFRVFNFRPDGDEKSTPNSFYNPVAMADALQKSMSPSHDSSFLYLYNNYGQTPLTRAVEAGNKVAVEALANASTEIDQKVIKEFKNGETVFSDTALLKAIKLKPIMVNETTMRDKEYIIKVLLKNGADSKISDVNGKSSFDYATHQRNLAKYEKENWFLLPDRSQIDHKILGIQLEYAEKIYKCIAYAEWSNLFSKYDF